MSRVASQRPEVSPTDQPVGEVDELDPSERVAAALDVPVSIAGILFVLVVIASNLTPPEAEWRWMWDVAIWVLWALFVAEFVTRMVVARSTSQFMRQHWWQAVFLAVPFLRFMRAFTRGARVARAFTSSVRGTRTAGHALGSRIAYLGAATVGVILAASQILFEFGQGITYGDALHGAAYSTISGQPLRMEGTLARVTEIVLALYAVVLFASLAGTVGAYFLRPADEH
jgi:voltage-gated potassium channel